MININYQSFGNRGFQLRLRLYQDGETKYITVTRFLKGAIQKRHWNPQKQLFTPSCPFSEENNAILTQFRQKYEEMAINWVGSIAGMLSAIEVKESEIKHGLTISGFIKSVVDELIKRKHADGTLKGTYECYEKLDRRLAEYCKSRDLKYNTILITELTPVFVNDVFDWVTNTKKGKGLSYISPMLHSIVGKAVEAGHVKEEDFAQCKWHKRQRGSVHKTRTLTDEQCRKFVELDPLSICASNKSQLYKDFCVFTLYTGQSACDAISLQYSDIEVINGVRHFVFRRRKISHHQLVPCAVPINIELERIMERWRPFTKDGYVFPIRSNATIRATQGNNADIKSFISKLNMWLKKVGVAIGCPFLLHSYTFRHTSITRYLSKGIPVIYIANMMGTSVENCEKIYYNNLGDVNSQNKVLAAVGF